VIREADRPPRARLVPKLRVWECQSLGKLRFAEGRKVMATDQTQLQSAPLPALDARRVAPMLRRPPPFLFDKGSDIASLECPADRILSAILAMPDLGLTTWQYAAPDPCHETEFPRRLAFPNPQFGNESVAIERGVIEHLAPRFRRSTILTPDRISSSFDILVSSFPPPPPSAFSQNKWSNASN